MTTAADSRGGMGEEGRTARLVLASFEMGGLCPPIPPLSLVNSFLAI